MLLLMIIILLIVIKLSFESLPGGRLHNPNSIGLGALIVMVTAMALLLLLIMSAWEFFM